jgi:hypothetical protein
MPWRWYDPAMQPMSLPPGPFAVRDEGAGRIVLESRGPEAAVVVITGYAGPSLPPDLVDALLEQAGPGVWRLVNAGATTDFVARGVEVLVSQPGLFGELTAPFALKRRERRLVGVLLRLLRLPGGAWLLRRWHSRRS